MKRNRILTSLALLVFGVFAFYAFAQDPTSRQQETGKRFVLLQRVQMTMVGESSTTPSFKLCPDIHPYEFYRSKGKAVIELKDGSIQEFDLDNVKTVVLQ
jgi:hypothetical protein